MNSKKDIYLFTNEFPYGASEAYLTQELKILSTLNLNISIVPLNISKKYDTISKYQEFNVINLDTSTYNSSKINFVKKIELLFIHISDLMSAGNFNYIKEKYKHNYALLLRLYYKSMLFREAIKNNSDSKIIYSYWFSDIAVIAGFSAQNQKGVSTISRAHGFDVFEEQNRYHVIPFRKFQLKRIDKIASVSKNGENYLTSKYPQFKSKFSTSCLGTLDSGFNKYSATSEFSIATCSIIRNVKRLELLPEILKHIKFELTWHVLGDGPDLDQLKEKTKTLPTNIKVIFHGMLSDEQITKFYTSNPIHLLVSLSSSEGLPVSMMEAISYGIPLLSTNVGGCSEICTPETGILIEKDFDNEKVAQLISEFKNSSKNNSVFREGVKKFWNLNFNAETNYTKFAKELLDYK